MRIRLVLSNRPEFEEEINPEKMSLILLCFRKVVERIAESKEFRQDSKAVYFSASVKVQYKYRVKRNVTWKKEIKILNWWRHSIRIFCLKVVTHHPKPHFGFGVSKILSWVQIWKMRSSIYSTAYTERGSLLLLHTWMNFRKGVVKGAKRKCLGELKLSGSMSHCI